MRIPSTPRRAGARSKPVQFTYVSTEKGQPYEAYLAGPVWWGYLHMTRPSKPCVFELTEGKMACRFHDPKFIPVVKGWVPLYRRIDGLAMCVPVDEALRDELDALTCFTKVAVGRGKGRGVGVWVRACLEQTPVWDCTLPERKEPADITESLIRMWGAPEIASYFECCSVSDTAVSLTTTKAREVEPVKPVGAHKPDAQPYTAPDPLDSNDAFVETVRRTMGRASAYDAKPSKNGSAKRGESTE